MSLWTALEPSSATVDAGGSTRVQLRLRNTGDVVDEYRFEPVGPVAPWTIVEPVSLRLYPGTTGTVDLTFSPPRTPDATAGPNPYAVRITPTEHPEATTVPEGNLTITPFTEVRAEIVPPTVKGRFRGRPRLAVDNLGNTKITASISGSDNGDHLSYDIHPGSVQIEPGRAAFVKTTLKPRKIIWFGPKEQRPYTLAVQRSGIPPVPVEGTYLQRGFLPRWLATFLGIITALALTGVMLWIAYKPQVASGAREKPVEAGQTLAPTTPPPVAPPPVTTPPPAQSQAPAGGSGGGGEKSKPKPLVPASRVLLRNTTTKKCADLAGNDKGKINDAVQEFTCNGSDQDNQLWNLVVDYSDQGPGGSPLFVIQNVKDELCMDLGEYGGRPLDTPIGEFTCDKTTADNQLWWIAKQADGGLWIRNYASDNMCLQVKGYGDGGDNTPLTIHTCSNDDDREWRIDNPT